MKKTKLLTIISLAAALSFSVLSADNNTSLSNIDKKCESKCQMNKDGAKKCNSFKTHRHNYRHNMGDRDGMRMFSNLNLSDTQKKSLHDLRSNGKMDRKNSMMKNHGDAMVGAVTAHGFNKAKFIEISTREYKDRITKKADHMEKVFAILTPAQKAELNKKLHEKR